MLAVDIPVYELTVKVKENGASAIIALIGPITTPDVPDDQFHTNFPRIFLRKF
jgi:hypothetical protein